jgi:hypothetical protein
MCLGRLERKEEKKSGSNSKDQSLLLNKSLPHHLLLPCQHSAGCKKGEQNLAGEVVSSGGTMIQGRGFRGE